MNTLIGLITAACRSRVLFFVIALVVLVASAAHATTYYVSPDGADAHDGSLGAPWATIARALDQAAPGDSVCLRGGVYREQVTTVRNGSDGRPITIVAYPGETPYLDGTDATMRNGMIVVHDYIGIVGLTIRNWADTGIWLQANADHLLIRACTVVDCGAGIDIYEGVHDFVIDSVDLSRFREESHGLDMTSHDGTPIYNGLVSNSRAHDGGGGNCDGFALGHRNDGDVYGSFGDIHDVRLVNCTVYNVGDGFDISGRDNRLEGCVAHDTYYGGNYKLWGVSVTLVNCIGYDGGVNVELDHYIQRSPNDPAGTPPPHVDLYNCTFFNGTSYNISLETDSCRLRMFNSIVLGGANIGMNFGDLFTRASYEGDYNIFGCDNPARMMADPQIDVSLEQFRDGGWRTLSGQDAHSIAAFDPLAVVRDTSAATIDLRPRPGSPAIDAGVVIDGRTPTRDRDGLARDAAIDIGAFEYQQAGGVDAPRPVPQPTLRSRLVRIGDRLFVELGDDVREDVRVDIVDVGGRRWWRSGASIEPGNRRIEIPADELPIGAYLITLRTGQASASCMVTIVR